MRKANTEVASTLGPMDVQARSVCSLVLADREFEALSRRAYCEEEDSKDLEMLLELSKRGLGFCDLKKKSKALGNNVERKDPAVMRKALSKDQKARLKLLGLMLETQPSDTEAFEAVMSKTTWLKQNADLAALSFGGSSLITTALRCGAQEALTGLLKNGVNVWLAANQAGSNNPYEYLATRGSSV